MSVGWSFHRTVLVFCSPIVACVAPPYGLGDSPNDLVQFQVVGWVCRWVDELPRVSSDKIKHFRQGTSCGVALFLIARGVPVHEFVASDHPAGLQRSYEHQLANCQLPIAKLYSCTIANSSNCKLPNCIIAQLSEDL